MRRPFMTAHAGCMGTEANTIKSVEAAIHVGADIIEVDVRSTPEGVAILSHDPVDPKEVKKLTKLEDILPIVSGTRKIVNLDLKDMVSIKPMVQAVKKHKMVTNVIVTGCNQEMASQVKKVCPEIQVLLNVDQDYVEKMKGDLSIRKICQEAASALCCGINTHYKFCTEEFVRYAQLRCFPVFIWTLEDEKDMKKYIHMGVDSITTKQVDVLKSLLY